MTKQHAVAQLFTLSLRKRIFCGLAIVLLLLAALAGVALHGFDAVSSEAARVSRASSQAASATAVALQANEARVRRCTTTPGASAMPWRTCGTG